MNQWILPNEITHIIFKYVGSYSRIAKFVCKHWRRNFHYLRFITGPHSYWITTIIDLIPYGNLRLLIWAKNNGCRFGSPGYRSNCCRIAAMYGNIPILRWLKNNGLYWDNDALLLAIKYGHVNTFKWLVANQ